MKGERRQVKKMKKKKYSDHPLVIRMINTKNKITC